MAQAKLFGSSIKRREDPRMITGRGVYTDDVKLPGQTHAAFVRSPHAHAAGEARGRGERRRRCRASWRPSPARTWRKAA